MGEYLQLSPPELKFRFELRKNIPVTLSLHNPGDETVAFKVKTTAPKKYCVRPSSGVVEPKATKDIQVIMQAQRENPTSFTDCKDKFLVQSCIVSNDIKDVSGDVFEKAGDVKQTKLRVVLMSPPKPPSPVPEGVEEESSPANGDRDDDAAGTGPAEDIVTVTKERNKLRDQLVKVERDKDSIKRRLDLLEDQNQGQPLQSNSKQGLVSGSFSLLHLLFVAILAFILGHYL